MHIRKFYITRSENIYSLHFTMRFNPSYHKFTIHIGSDYAYGDRYDLTR
jgi:hypothetical protein